MSHTFSVHATLHNQPLHQPFLLSCMISFSNTCHPHAQSYVLRLCLACSQCQLLHQPLIFVLHVHYTFILQKLMRLCNTLEPKPNIKLYLSCMLIPPSSCTFQLHAYSHVWYLVLAFLHCTLQDSWHALLLVLHLHVCLPCTFHLHDLHLSLVTFSCLQLQNSCLPFNVLHLCHMSLSLSECVRVVLLLCLALLNAKPAHMPLTFVLHLWILCLYIHISCIFVSCAFVLHLWILCCASLSCTLSCTIISFVLHFFLQHFLAPLIPIVFWLECLCQSKCLLPLSCTFNCYVHHMWRIFSCYLCIWTNFEISYLPTTRTVTLTCLSTFWAFCTYISCSFVLHFYLVAFSCTFKQCLRYKYSGLCVEW